MVEVDGGRDEVEGSSVGEDDGGDDVVVEVSRKGTKPEDEVPVVGMVIVVGVEESNSGSKPVGVGVVTRFVVTVDGVPVEAVVMEESKNGIKPELVVMVEAMVEVMVEVMVVEEMRNGVRPVVGGATVVLLERRYGSRPEVDGELVVVVRSLSLKGKIPFGPGVVVTTSKYLKY